MAIFTPDYKYIEGKDVIEKLQGKEGEAARYFVEENFKITQKLRDQLTRLTDAISTIKNFGRY